METHQDTAGAESSAIATKPKGPDASIVINALRVNYPGRFDEDDIQNEKLRKPLNVVCRALDGITAIAKILYANEVERDSGGEGAEVLDTSIIYGLFEALVFLVENGNSNASDLGIAIPKKGGAA